MNIETAKRLLEYRKANGYSQEELAEKIGVSRQAISKWERSESSPDTDNLIALSKLYGITIDELLNGTDKPTRTAQSEYSGDERADEAKNDQEKEEVPAAPAEPDTDTDEKRKRFYEKGRELIRKGEQLSKNPHFHALLPITILLIYLLISFIFPRFWAVGWILFLLIPIIETGLTAIRTRNPLRFAYPALAAAIYFFEGMVFHIWHPTWIIFLTIPIYYIACDAYRRSKPIKENELPAPQISSNGTYYQPVGTNTYYPTPAPERKHGSVIGKIIITVICAVTVITTVAVVCTFSWLKDPSFASGISDIVGSIVGYSTWGGGDDSAYTIGSGEVAAEGITRLSVSWLNHSVTIEYYDGDTIAFSEPEQVDSDYSLRWLLSGDELKIGYCKSGLKWVAGTDRNKDLTIYLPNGFSLNEINIDTVSANIYLNGLTAHEIELHTVSGNITADGSFAKVEFDTVSGNAEITPVTIPTKMEFHTVSGSMRAYVPEDISGFTVKYDTISGDASVKDFEVKIPQKKMLVYGDGSTYIDFDSVSGDLEIKKAP